MLYLFVDLEILAVGGIDMDKVADFISAGALGVGIGTKLVGGDIFDSHDHALLGHRTEQYMQRIQSAKIIN